MSQDKQPPEQGREEQDQSETSQPMAQSADKAGDKAEESGESTVSSTPAAPPGSDAPTGKPAAPEAKPDPGSHPETTATPPTRSSRSGIAGLLLGILNLLIILGLAAGAYLLLQNLENQRFAQSQKLNQLNQTVQQLDVAKQSRDQWFDGLQSQQSRQDDRIEELSRQQSQVQDNLKRSNEALSRLAAQVEGGAQAWQRAEVEHLLVVANTRLQLQQDVKAALIALRLADGRLGQMSDPAYFPVRKQVTAEISALEAVPPLDLQSLALKLDSLMDRLDTLQTRRARTGSFPSDLALGNADRQWYERLWTAMNEAVGEMVSIRRNVERREPLLPPEQGFYLRQNLRLQMESARLAILQQDSANYQAALRQAENWLERYFDTDQTAVQATLKSIREIQSTPLSRALPDISGSLSTLRRTRPEA